MAQSAPRGITRLYIDTLIQSAGMEGMLGSP